MEYDKAVKEGGYKPNNTMRTSAPRQEGLKTEKSARKRTAKEPNRKPLGMFEGIIDPAVGEVYHAWWNSVPKQNDVSTWYPVVILPYSGDCDWEEVGLSFNFWTSELAEELPACFKVAKVTTDARETSLRLTWAQGYQDGGPKVRSRKFPCLFLHPPLKIPSADKEWKLGSQDRVLAFLPAEDLRHRSTNLGPPVVYLVLKEYEGLVQAFETRLRAIRAKRAASEQEAGQRFPLRTPSMHDQQRPGVTPLVKASRSYDPFLRSDVQELPSSTEGGLSMLGDGRRYRLTRRDPRFWADFENSYDGKYPRIQGTDLNQTANMSLYRSVMPTTGTTYRPSPNGSEGGQLNGGEGDQSSAEPRASRVASRQAQPMGSGSQNVDSPFALQQPSSTSQTAACTSQNPRAALKRRGPHRPSQ